MARIGTVGAKISSLANRPYLPVPLGGVAVCADEANADGADWLWAGLPAGGG